MHTSATRNVFFTLFICLSIFSAAWFAIPTTADAARQCPPDLTMGQGTAPGCFDSTGRRMGTALDPAIATGCPTNTYPMLVSGGTVCSNANGTSWQTINSTTGEVNPETVDRQPPSNSCSVLRASLSFIDFDCVFKKIAWGLAWAIINITGWFLSLAAGLFDWVLQYAVVNFNSTMYAWVAGGVEAVWAAFRDIANIVIIGVFVFVAIEMILDTQVFGGKKTVANVLLIAILINFSLLFARLIIGSANFVSEQFYKAVQVTIGNPAEGSGSFSTQTASTGALTSGVSGKFAQMMGVGGVFATDDLIWKIAENPNGGAGSALLHGIFTGIIFVAAAFVLLYATFMMLARAIMLIFLTMTSSIAFATYLLPSNFLSGMGKSLSWSAWWTSILKASIFGPVLIILLWATIKVGEGITSHISGSLGAAISSPTGGGSLSAIFGYVIILGMLYASVSIAGSFASGAGLGLAHAGAKMFAASPFAAADRAFGWAGRRFLGGGAMRLSEGVDKEIASAQAKHITTMGELKDDNLKKAEQKRFATELAGLQRKKARYDSAANFKYQASGTRAGDFLYKAAGASFLKSGPVQGEAERQKKIIDQAAKTANQIAKLSDAAKDSIRSEAAKQAEEKHTKEAEPLKTQRDSATKENNSAWQNHEKELLAASERRKQLDEEMAELTRRETTGVNVATEKARVRSAMSEEDEKIKRAAEGIKRFQEHLDTTEAALVAHEGRREQVVKDAGDAAVIGAEKLWKDHSADLARELGATLAAQKTIVNREQVADAARARVKKERGSDAEKDKLLESLRDMVKAKTNDNDDEKKKTS